MKLSLSASRTWCDMQNSAFTGTNLLTVPCDGLFSWLRRENDQRVSSRSPPRPPGCRVWNASQNVVNVHLSAFAPGMVSGGGLGFVGGGLHATSMPSSATAATKLHVTRVMERRSDRRDGNFKNSSNAIDVCSSRKVRLGGPSADDEPSYATAACHGEAATYRHRLQKLARGISSSTKIAMNALRRSLRPESGNCGR